MRQPIAVVLLVSAACGSSPGQTTGSAGREDGTSTGASGGATLSASTSLSTSTSPSASTSTSTSPADDSSSSGDDTVGRDVPDPDPDPPQASEYCESIVDSFCAFYVRCGRMEVASEELCREPFLESCNAVFEPQYVGLEAAGLLTLSPEGLLACEEHLADVACEEQIFELTGPCSGVWAGTQMATDACGLDVEYFVCEPSAACTINLDFCGTCETLLEPGDDCNPEGTTCGPQAFCDAGECRARVPNGGTCTPEDRCMAGSACVEEACTGPTFVGLGDACDASRRCPYLTACIAGVCAPTARLGEACSEETPCEAGSCEGGTCQTPGDDGESCGGSGECSSGLCVEGSCVPRPSGCITN